MSTNKLKLNPDKTGFLLIGNEWQRSKYLSMFPIEVFGVKTSSPLCAICSQQVGCHGSPSFSILCQSDAVIIWYFCPFLDVSRPHCSRSPPSSSTIYPSFHQQLLYPISSYYMSKILTFPFFDSINNDLLVFILCKTSPLVLCSFHDIFKTYPAKSARNLGVILTKTSTSAHIYLQSVVHVFTTSRIYGVFAITLIRRVQNHLRML